jgi:hypothetical protein
MKLLAAPLVVAVILTTVSPTVHAQPRGAESWSFTPARGWRYELRPGIWSPYYVWWVVNGKVVLREPPTTVKLFGRIGNYELHGNGIDAAYHWVWVPNTYGEQPAPPNPPPAPPPNAPSMPPVGAPPLPRPSG